MKRTTFGATVVTVCWLTGVGLLIAFNWQSFKGMEPNAWGDFLAGSVASPLALIWLVASYMQQGDDLKLNTKALMLQQRELAEQVRATKELASHAEKQAYVTSAMHEFNLAQNKRANDDKIAERLRTIRPSILVRVTQKSGERWDLSLQNVAADAVNVKLFCPAFGSVKIQGDNSRFPANSLLAAYLERFLWTSDVTPILKIECSDVDGNPHEFNYRYDEPGYRFHLVDSENS